MSIWSYSGSFLMMRWRSNTGVDDFESIITISQSHIRNSNGHVHMGILHGIVYVTSRDPSGADAGAHNGTTTSMKNNISKSHATFRQK